MRSMINLERNHVGGGGRSAIQIVNGTDVVTAGGGGGGADCQVQHFCGGGGKLNTNRLLILQAELI